MRARTLCLTVAVMAQAAWVCGARAGAVPELMGAVGGTVAIEGGSGRSGPSVSLTAQWPLADHVRFGVTGALDDLGDRTGRLVDPSGVDYGPVSVLHQTARGAMWRLEAQAPPRGGYTALAAATWGVCQVVDDVRGTTLRRANVPVVGMGVGVTRAVGASASAGIGLRYQQLWRGAVQRYFAAALEWRWHRGGGA